MSKDDRAKVKAAVKESLFTLVNSTKKNLEDKEYDSLQERINKTLKAINEMANQLQADGYCKPMNF